MNTGLKNDNIPAKDLFFQWHITDACNYRCRHCYQDDFTKASDMPLEGLVKVYGNIASCAGPGKIKFNITGGEPFLRKDLFDFMRYLDKQDATGDMAVITNASLIGEDALGKLKELRKLKQIKISIDGATEKTNDAIRRSGAFKSALEKVNLIQEKTPFEVVIMLTVMRSNAYELPALFQLCRELKVDGLMIERFIPLGQSKGLRSEVVGKEDWKRLVREVCEYMETDAKEAEMLPCKAFWIKFKGDDAELLGAECNLGEDAFAIMPNGDLLPCRRFAMKIGNLAEKNLSDIIRDSRILKEVADRNNLKGKCRTCKVDNCRGCRAIAFAVGGDYLSEDPFCWL